MEFASVATNPRRSGTRKAEASSNPITSIELQTVGPMSLQMSEPAAQIAIVQSTMVSMGSS
jgi:hypothetical protein